MQPWRKKRLLNIKTFSNTKKNKTFIYFSCIFAYYQGHKTQYIIYDI